MTSFHRNAETRNLDLAIPVGLNKNNDDLDNSRTNALLNTEHNKFD